MADSQAVRKLDRVAKINVVARAHEVHEHIRGRCAGRAGHEGRREAILNALERPVAEDDDLALFIDGLVARDGCPLQRRELRDVDAHGGAELVGQIPEGVAHLGERAGHGEHGLRGCAGVCVVAGGRDIEVERHQEGIAAAFSLCSLRALGALCARGARIALVALVALCARGARIALVALVALRAGGARIALVALVALRAGGARIALVALVALRAGGARIALVALVALRAGGARIALIPLGALRAGGAACGLRNENQLAHVWNPALRTFRSLAVSRDAHRAYQRW